MIEKIELTAEQLRLLESDSGAVEIAAPDGRTIGLMCNDHEFVSEPMVVRALKFQFSEDKTIYPAERLASILDEIDRSDESGN